LRIVWGSVNVLGDVGVQFHMLALRMRIKMVEIGFEVRE
jgi:hypothetical protein